MTRRFLLIGPILASALAVSAIPAADEKAPAITWKKIVVEKKFRSEGVTVADVNQDGHLDILAGEVWFEGPDWKKVHEIRQPFRDYGDGLKSYSETFCCWADDLNADGLPDYIVIRFPGAPCYWYENPGAKGGHWKEHMIWHSACN